MPPGSTSRRRRVDERDRPAGDARGPVADPPARDLVWVVALAASMVGTAAAVAGLYNTPEKIHSYAEAVTAGDALVAINGRVEGIDSLGGIIQDEFGFLAAFLLPLLGISLVAQATRREEEDGRLETILGGRVARHAPVLAALVMALGRHRRSRSSPSRSASSPPASRRRRCPLRRLPRRARLRLRRARGAARPGHAARPRRLPGGPARPRPGLRAAGRRRRDDHVGHLAVPAGLGREGRAVRADALVGTADPPRRRRAARDAGRRARRSPRPRQRPGPPGCRTSPGDARGCAVRSGWRAPSTARPLLGWLAGALVARGNDGRALPAVPGRGRGQPGHGRGRRDVERAARRTVSSPSPSSTSPSSPWATPSRRSAACTARRRPDDSSPGSPASCRACAGSAPTGSSSSPVSCSSSWSPPRCWR